VKSPTFAARVKTGGDLFFNLFTLPRKAALNSADTKIAKQVVDNNFVKIDKYIGNSSEVLDRIDWIASSPEQWKESYRDASRLLLDGMSENVMSSEQEEKIYKGLLGLGFPEEADKFLEARTARKVK
jgi:hypothetical protein